MVLLVTCPSCSSSFEMAEDALVVKATLPCPRCGRIVVVWDAQAVPLGGDEGTVPYDPGTNALIEIDESTEVAGSPTRLALPRGRRISVAILSGPRKGEMVTLAQPRLVIGREGGGPDVDLQLEDDRVSRSHAAVECYGARTVLKDLGSRNGTYVGDEPIQSYDLADQTEFRVGDTRLVLLIADRH